MGYKINEDRHRHCLECGNEIGYGRPDRKFCSPNCKNRYNNRKVRNYRNMKLRVQNALDKNHEILRQLVRLGVGSVSLSELSVLGFNLSYSTSHTKAGGHDEYMCYDIRYFKTATRIFSIREVPAFPPEPKKEGRKKPDSSALSQG